MWQYKRPCGARHHREAVRRVPMPMCCHRCGEAQEAELACRGCQEGLGASKEVRRGQCIWRMLGKCLGDIGEAVAHKMAAAAIGVEQTT